LAATPESMMLDVLLTNRDNVLDALADYRASLQILENALTSDPANLQKLLKAGADKRSRLVRD
jgi:hypothetical protein